MKLWIWVIMGVLMMVAADMLLPDLVWFMIVMPLLLVGLLIFNVFYNYRKLLQLIDVPNKGYQHRLLDLDRVAANLERLSFRKIDQFYLKSIPALVTYAFKPKKEPFLLYAHHMGQKPIFAIITRFVNGYSLITPTNVDAGGCLEPPNHCCIFSP